MYDFIKSGSDIESYISGIICPRIAPNLHSVSIMPSYCFFCQENYSHFRSDCYLCYCCCCQLKNILEDI